jgi:glycosyltransferase involved in cell wall biosynthesis
MPRYRAILMNCLSSRSGGAVSYIRHVVEPLARSLAIRGIRFIPLIRGTQSGHLPPGLILDVVRVPDAQIAGLRRASWELSNLARIVRENECGLVFTPYQIATLLPSAINVVMLRNMEPFFSRRYRYSLGSHLRNEVLRIQTSRTLRRADATIAVSEFVASYARTQLRVDASRVTTVYHGRDEEFSPAAGPEDDHQLQRLAVVKPYAFSCGSLLPYRRLEDVLHAFEQLVRTVGDEAQLVIAGSGTDGRYGKMIQEAINASGTNHRIRNLGQIDNALMKILYRHCRIFITATEVEACPNIAIEAMSSGCAIVAADSPALLEILGPGAAFFPPRDHEQLSSQMAVVWRDSERRVQLAAAALRRSVDFSWALCAAQTGELLGSLLP